MQLDDLSDPNAELNRMQKALKRVPPQTSGGGDSDHASTGIGSVAVGSGAEGSGIDSSAFGKFASASGETSTAVGAGAAAEALRSSAFGVGSYASAQRGSALGGYSIATGYEGTGVGYRANSGHLGSTAVGAFSQTTATRQVMLGTSSDTVVVPGTFSNPSARHLKRNIIPAPDLRDLFPELTEWEYIDGDGRRRLGYIADELVGTGAERFVTFDDAGHPNGIDYLGLLVAQVAVLRAEIAALKNDGR